MAITFGSSTAPSQLTENFDSLFGTSLANYNKTLVDNIGTSNAFFNKMMNSGFYQSFDGGTWIQEPLMYQLGTMNSYEGYDELSTIPTDGITNSIFEWRQLAVPVSYSMREVKQNKQKIVDLIKARIMQAEMGIQEGFALAFFNGNGAAALATPKTDPINGSTNIEPIGKLISYTPTATGVVGNIDQATSSWWRNNKTTSAATNLTGFGQELDHLYNTCALGTGGPPDLHICDQTTYELITQMLWLKYRQTQSDNTFPFENMRFKKSIIVMDEKIPDVDSGTVATTTYGSLYFINTKFFRLRYEADTNFVMLKDENGKTFAKPTNGDSRVGHIAWAGNVTVNNRRKHGILGKIARTLIAS